MMVYNKTVVDWLLGQRQLCLTLERTCCPKPQSSGQTKLLLSSNPVNNCRLEISLTSKDYVIVHIKTYSTPHSVARRILYNDVVYTP